jgi:hydrogenase maturation protease
MTRSFVTRQQSAGLREPGAGAVRVLAVGSPHGDDQVGWEALRQLRRQLPAGVVAAAVADPLGVLDWLDGCACLVLVDACHSGAPPGTVVRLAWPDDRLAGRANPSSHGFGVAEVLALAEALGRLPPRVVLMGVDAAACQPGAALSPPVRAALAELTRRVLEEVGCRGAGA